MSKLYTLSDRQCFRTAHGRFGFTIRGVQSGDVLVVFDTATTPHVLRNASDDNDKYLVIGDAYVDGIMYGEADSLEIEARDFVLV
jgi:uncharacterized cupin superfamily protein